MRRREGLLLSLIQQPQNKAMVITAFDEKGKSEIKVSIDGEYAFILTRKEIEQLDLAVGMELSAKIYQRICDELVLPRAKQKALGILKFMDRSEKELRKKLADSDFPKEIIEKTIAYVTEYGYLCDERYAASYIRQRIGTKSRLILTTELLQKGIPRELINHIFENEFNDNEEIDYELNAIKKAIAKKTTKGNEELTYEEKQKLMASLYRKGFDPEKIKRVLK